METKLFTSKMALSQRLTTEEEFGRPLTQKESSEKGMYAPR